MGGEVNVASEIGKGSTFPLPINLADSNNFEEKAILALVEEYTDRTK